MKVTTESFRQKQFQTLFSGTLLYAVVMGFFNDYTDILYTKSFSTLFLAALVMQVLTMLTFRVKRTVSAQFKGRDSKGAKFGHVLSVWLVLFLSKFVFLEVIDFIFGNNVELSGFIGLMGMIIVMTVLDRLSAWAYRRLG